MKAWTDYPFLDSDIVEELSMREVDVISYDGDKRLLIRFRGLLYEIKAGYVYSRFETGGIPENPSQFEEITQCQ